MTRLTGAFNDRLRQPKRSVGYSLARLLPTLPPLPNAIAATRSLGPAWRPLDPVPVAISEDRVEAVSPMPPVRLDLPNHLPPDQASHSLKAHQRRRRRASEYDAPRLRLCVAP
eukprot:1179260-Prorocentrum_minimum.AAC.1